MDYLVDTNVWIYATRNHIDLQELLGKKPLLAKQVLQELEKLNTKEVKLTLSIIRSKKLKTVDLGQGHTDNLLIKYAKQHKITIITNDLRLRKRLKKHKINALFLRQGRLLGE